MTKKPDRPGNKIPASYLARFLPSSSKPKRSELERFIEEEL